MGFCISHPIINDKDDVAGSRALTGLKRDKLRGFLTCLTRPAFLSRSNSIPAMVTKRQFAVTLHDSSCYWVYAKFSDQHNFVNPSFCALDIKEKKYVLLPNQRINTCLNNASSVMDNKLYVIGGRRGGSVSGSVHSFDPVLNDWSDTNPTTVHRTGGVAVSIDGKVYVFGGCDRGISDWGEVYEPSTKIWTPIPGSQVLIEALEKGLSPLWASAVLGKKIILRGSRTGIAFDVMSNSWTQVSDNLIENWWNFSRAAALQNMLITCHSEYVEHEISQRSIRAYDPDEDVWIMLEGIDRSFHENSHRSQFMSVNGKLVIYHMYEQNYLRFSIFDINPRHRTTVRAKLLWQSRFPIATIVEQGLDIHPGYLRKNVYGVSLLEPLRANGS